MEKRQPHFNPPAWWGSPKNFDVQEEDRRVSWLELFFDLVYVIAISRITHLLIEHLTVKGFLEYITLFLLVYWGWLNGSLHHDLHGSSGLRTRLMTLWQMMIIAAFAIVIDKYPADHHYTAIVFMVMQLFITYQWWSVGIYDKNHRQYSWPYITLYLIAFGLMGLSLLAPESWLWIIIPLVIICNYGPPFFSLYVVVRVFRDFSMSSSMFERLGLFTIIIFGELVLGVVNGVVEAETLNAAVWLNFAVALALVFGLWWLFFSMISNRNVKNSFLKATLLQLLYVPTLVSLSLLAAGFSTFFEASGDTSLPHGLFGYSIAAFLICINLITGLLDFPETIMKVINHLRRSIVVTAAIFILYSLLPFPFTNTWYVLWLLIILCSEIVYLNYTYYKGISKREPGTKMD